MDENIENPRTADSGDETWCVHAPQFCAGGYSSWTGHKLNHMKFLHRMSAER